MTTGYGIVGHRHPCIRGFDLAFNRRGRNLKHGVAYLFDLDDMMYLLLLDQANNGHYLPDRASSRLVIG
jgi:hypothetical protein